MLKNKNKSNGDNKFNFTAKDIFTWILVLFMIFALVVGAFMVGGKVAEMKYGKEDTYKICEKENHCDNIHYDYDFNRRDCAEKYCENLSYDQYGNPIMNKYCNKTGFDKCMNDIQEKQTECYDKQEECRKKLDAERNFIIAGVAVIVGIIFGVIGLIVRKDKSLFIGFLASSLLVLAISGIILGTDGFPLLLISGVIVAAVIYFRDKVFG
ncbi:MAG: hypothetical protein CVT89_05755 [Candidatus Altiarchaeales archaeon HGW-Altiarchaeales-2]|nr:MAG: hypothetical protein CVT89_05755 [Candidatus Altiarchaeales archaeon HGW-Altiarchaeales-2]